MISGMNPWNMIAQMFLQSKPRRLLFFILTLLPIQFTSPIQMRPLPSLSMEALTTQPLRIIMATTPSLLGLPMQGIHHLQ